MNFSQEAIEASYRSKLNEYEHNQKRSKTTQCESVLHFLLEHPEKIWWWSYELIGKSTKNGHYLSHRAPARASDLAIHESQLVEDRSIGRFKIYRLRTENMHLINKRLGI